MLRIRGSLYLGRQYESQKANNGGSDNDSETHDDDSFGADDHEAILLRQRDEDDMEEDEDEDDYAGSSLLEKILTCPQQQRVSPVPGGQQIITSQSLCSGGSVEDIGREPVHTKLAILAAEAGNMPLTPPPSISGERGSTPPGNNHWLPARGDVHRDAPLDLTVKLTTPTPKSSPLVLEQQHQGSDWRVIVNLSLIHI